MLYLQNLLVIICLLLLLVICVSYYFIIQNIDQNKTIYYDLMLPALNQMKLVLKNIIKMENNDKLKGIDIKSRTCYYFYDIIKSEDFDFYNILID